MIKEVNSTSLKEYRRILRNNPTPAELLLWQYLKSSQLAGRSFRRQYSFKNKIYDFYCPKEKLVIELNGSIHNDAEVSRNDLEKEELANSFNIKVLRYKNTDVLYNLNLVLENIKSSFLQDCEFVSTLKLNLPPTPFLLLKTGNKKKFPCSTSTLQ